MQSEQPSIPLHMGFIVDGNRRWAKKHGLPAYEGHLAGHNALKEILPRLLDAGVEYVSFYLFSTENWKRSKEEVSFLMKLLMRIFKEDLKELIKHEVRVRVLGTREGLSDKIIEAINYAEAETKHFTRATIGVCFNYGGQLEIASAAQQCVADGVEPTTENLRARLYAPDIPDVDVVVRTSGEQRLSNFMLWRTAYSEFIFLKKFWPELRTADIDAILKEYARRNRRFGGN